MIQEKEEIIDGKPFILSKFPAIDGREIVTCYISSGIPKVGSYKHNEEMMLKLMKFVQVPREGGGMVKLETAALVNSHIASWETLAKVEMAMMEYNCSFFSNGQISNLLRNTAQKLPAWISKILTDSLAQLSQKEKQASTSSEPSTP